MVLRHCSIVVSAAFAAALSTLAAAQSGAGSLKINQIQVIGTHNSYHAGFAPSQGKLIEQANEKGYESLDYRHHPLPAQFDAGVRQIELDVFADTKGGLYAHPLGLENIAKAGLPPDPPFDPNGVMEKPGFKVMHMQDIDYRSVCQPFTECLQEVRAWSHAHPHHIPIFILVETKQEKPASYQRVVPEPFTPAIFDALDAEIRSVFKPGEIILPDDVRGSYPTLNAAILAGNWPTLAQARGKVIFLMDQLPMESVYTEGHPSLQGRILFTNSIPGRPDSAFVERNEGPVSSINDLVRQGYLVRTRTDEPTNDARTDNTAKRDTMMASGAQILSTDYPSNEPARWEGHYVVEFPGNVPARCNPVTAPPGCTESWLK